MKGKLFVVSASSGAGKTTVVNCVIDRLESRVHLKRLVTYTNREPRSNEKHGEDYFFIDSNEFKMKIEAGYFIEWAQVYGFYYGSPKSCMDDMQKGLSYIAIVDYVGACSLVKVVKEAILIWIYTSSINSLKQRLIKRGENSPIQLKERLKFVIKEREYSAFYRYHILNDDINSAVKELGNLVATNLGISFN